MKQSYNCSTTYMWEDEDNNRSLTFEVDGYVSRYVPAVINAPVERCHPAEGGELEEWRVRLVDVEYWGDSTQPAFKNMTPEQIKQIEDEADAELQKGGPIFDHVEECLFEDANDRSEPDADYLYDRMRDEG